MNKSVKLHHFDAVLGKNASFSCSFSFGQNFFDAVLGKTASF